MTIADTFWKFLDCLLSFIYSHISRDHLNEKIFSKISCKKPPNRFLWVQKGQFEASNLMNLHNPDISSHKNIKWVEPFQVGVKLCLKHHNVLNSTARAQHSSKITKRPQIGQNWVKWKKTSIALKQVQNQIRQNQLV